MVERQYVLDLVRNIKTKAQAEIVKDNIESALELIFNCASVLYQTNIYYVDEELEIDLKNISKSMNFLTAEYAPKDCLVFYDGFGLNDRGLVQIYLKALCKIKRVIYVTYDDCKNHIPDILNIYADELF